MRYPASEKAESIELVEQARHFVSGKASPMSDVVLSQAGLSIHDAPDERLEAGAIVRTPHAADFLGGRDAIGQDQGRRQD